MLRKEEEDLEFKKKLQNPLKPINDTSASPEMQEYLRKLNSGELGKEEREKQEQEKAKQLAEEEKYDLYCPTCKKKTVKRTAHRTYACSFCGLESVNPLVMKKKENV